jgi:hypothetical protein
MRTLLALLAALPLGGAPLRAPTSPEPDPAPPTTSYRALALAAAGDPDVTAVQAAAARIADAGGEDAATFPRRARLAALLPRITAEYRHAEQSSRVVGLQGAGEVDYLRLAPVDAFLVRATWDLGALVAATGEVPAASGAAVRARRRAEAVSHATALLFERRDRRLALLLAPPADALARAHAELEIDRLGAILDALTGGLISRGGP